MRGHIYSYFISRVVASITLQLIPLYVVKVGGPEHLSLAFFLIYLGNMVSSFYTEVLKGREVIGLLLGHTALTLPLILLVQGADQALMAALLASLISPLSYFSGLLHMYSYEGKRAAWKYERISRWSWLSGLFLGAVGVKLLDVEGMAELLAFSNVLLTIPLLFLLDLKPKLGRALSDIKRQGLLPLMEEKIVAMGRAEEDYLRRFAIKVKSYGPLFPRPVFISLGRPSRLTLKASLAFFGMGLVYSQLVGYERASGVDSSTVFFFSALSSLITLIFYRKASGYKNLDLPILGRGLTFVMLASMSPNLGLFLLFHVIEGVTWAYLIVPLYEISLNKSTKQLGFVNFIRFSFWMMGSLLSHNVLVLGYSGLFVIASLFLFASTLVGVDNQSEVEGVVNKLAVKRLSALVKIKV